MFDTALDESELALVRGDINSILLRSQACLALEPADTAEALVLADTAFIVAEGWNLRREVSKAEFYRAECYRRMEKWRMALQCYVRAAGWGERMPELVYGSRICLDKIDEMEKIAEKGEKK